MNASNDYRYDSAGALQDRSLRVGDKERDAVSEILRQAHGEGRLDAEEFQVRLERCLTAKTYADLDALVADVPRAGADLVRTRQRFPGRRLGPARFIFLPIVVAIAAIAIGVHAAWLVFPLFFFFVVRPLMWRGRRGGWGRGPWGGGPMSPGRVP